jgi:hypothetical protein
VHAGFAFNTALGACTVCCLYRGPWSLVLSLVPLFCIGNVLIEFEFHVDFLDRIRRLLVLQLWLA